MPRIVTLTTDFGSGSAYVAEMKGRLLHARVTCQLVDIDHDLPRHDLRAAAWLVGRACPAFPAGSLHLVVVDPGVGTRRRLVWVRAGDREYLGPDNGVLTAVLAAAPAARARALSVPADASSTFHGRDVIAPAAVALLEGTDPASLGPVAEDLVRIPVATARDTGHGIDGEIVHVDGFGNLLTNLPATLLPRLLAAGRLRVGDHEVTNVVRTYADAAPGALVALVGSQGVIEAAVVEGRAADLLAAGVGTRVHLP